MKKSQVLAQSWLSEKDELLLGVGRDRGLDELHLQGLGAVGHELHPARQVDRDVRHVFGTTGAHVLPHGHATEAGVEELATEHDRLVGQERTTFAALDHDHLGDHALLPRLAGLGFGPLVDRDDDPALLFELLDEADERQALVLDDGLARVQNAVADVADLDADDLRLLGNLHRRRHRTRVELVQTFGVVTVCLETHDLHGIENLDRVHRSLLRRGVLRGTDNQLSALLREKTLEMF